LRTKSHGVFFFFVIPNLNAPTSTHPKLNNI
jgi:hypothetical protein